MTSKIEPLLQQIVDKQPYPLIFASLSGAHLYGFPSSDSDYDLRGVHCLPLKTVIGLDDGELTRDSMSIVEGFELDIVTHDIKTYCHLLLKKNGNALEQIMSPHIVVTSPEHDILRTIAQGCITRYFAYHYLGFSRNKYKEFSNQSEKRVKTLLYIYRVLLTGIYLMKTGAVEANLVYLNQEFKLSYLDNLIAQKQENGEKAILQKTDLTFHDNEISRLTIILEDAHDTTSLPENPLEREAFNNWLIETRLTYGN
ncbi:MAG: nucleotidyltransferase domain-containing protein [Chloroflexota bacterium]